MIIALQELHSYTLLGAEWPYLSKLWVSPSGMRDTLPDFHFVQYMSQLLLLGKFQYGGGPIFKVVLEC